MLKIDVVPVGPLVKVLFPKAGYGADDDWPESLLDIGAVPVGAVAPLVKVPLEGVGYGTDEDNPESALELPVPSGAVPVLDGEFPDPKDVDITAPPVPVPSGGRV